MMLWEYLKLLKNIITLPVNKSFLPKHIQLDITTSCNLNCKMCYAKRVLSENERHSFLTLEKFKEIVDYINPLSVNLAASGEPLLNKQIFDIIRYAKSKQSQVIVSTNFIVPNQEMINKIIDSGLDVLKISIDGASKNVYENIRGPYYDKLLKNLELLQNGLKNSNNSMLSPRFDFVILKTNASDIKAIVELAARFGVKHIFYRICDPRGWDLKDREELLKGSAQDIRKSLEEAYSFSKKMGVETNIKLLLEKFAQWNFIYEDGGIKDSFPVKNKPVCVLPWMQLFCSVNGDSSYCCSIYPSKEYNLGNVFEKDFNEIWNYGKIKDVRRLFKQKKNYELFEGCRYCIPMSRGYLFNIIKMFPGYIKKLVLKKK